MSGGVARAARETLADHNRHTGSALTSLNRVGTGPVNRGDGLYQGWQCRRGIVQVDGCPHGTALLSVGRVFSFGRFTTVQQVHNAVESGLFADVQALPTAPTLAENGGDSER